MKRYLVIKNATDAEDTYATPGLAGEIPRGVGRRAVEEGDGGGVCAGHKQLITEWDQSKGQCRVLRERGARLFNQGGGGHCSEAGRQKSPCEGGRPNGKWQVHGRG